MITELRYASACLANFDAGTPNPAALQRSTREIRIAADRAFDEWLHTLPQSLVLDVEDRAVLLAGAWQADAYERGFRAGIRLMCQAMGGGFDEDN